MNVIFGAVLVIGTALLLFLSPNKALSAFLSGGEKALYRLKFQGWAQLGRVDAVIFNRITGAHDMRMFQPRYRMQKSQLDIHRHAR